MAKVKLNQRASSAGGAYGSNTPALLSLIFGILGWLVLPVIGALVAIICGHMGRKQSKAGAPRGGMALAGLILGYSSLLLTIAVIALAMPAYENYVQRMQAEQALSQHGNNDDGLAHELDAIAANNPTEALDMAKMWVAARLSKGAALNEVNEELSLSPEQQKFWRKISVQQGTISAIPAQGNGKQALVLLSMQEGNKLVWICGGEIPAIAKAACQ